MDTKILKGDFSKETKGSAFYDKLSPKARLLFAERSEVLYVNFKAKTNTLYRRVNHG